MHGRSEAAWNQLPVESWNQLPCSWEAEPWPEAKRACRQGSGNAWKPSENAHTRLPVIRDSRWADECRIVAGKPSENAEKRSTPVEKKWGKGGRE